MAGETDLQKLLAAMSPLLLTENFVFCTVSGKYSDYQELSPLASFCEHEGLTLVLTEKNAIKAKLPFESVFKAITLSVHSSLNAVGLTAAVASQLADRGISANVIAAYYHDHIFVQAEKATQAMEALKELCLSNMLP